MLPTSADKNQRRALWWYFVRDRARDTTSVSLLGLLAIMAIGGMLWYKHQERLDVRDSIPIQAEGVITTVSYSQADKTPWPQRVAFLMVDGNTLLPSPDRGGVFPHSLGPLQKGARVRYTYRVGKSGRWYLDWIDPLPPHSD